MNSQLGNPLANRLTITKIAHLYPVNPGLYAKLSCSIGQTGEPSIEHFRSMNNLHISYCIIQDTTSQEIEYPPSTMRKADEVKSREKHSKLLSNLQRLPDRQLLLGKGGRLLSQFSEVLINRFQRLALLDAKRGLTPFIFRFRALLPQYIDPATLSIGLKG